MDTFDFNKLEQCDSVTCRREVMQFFEESRRTREEMLITVKSLTTSVDEVRRDLDNFRESTRDLVEVFDSLKGLNKIVLWIGKMLKPIAAITLFFATIHFYLNGIKIPKLTP